MAWQACPVCYGAGTVPNTHDVGTTSVYSYRLPCPTCGGARIINEATGLPPHRENVKPPELPGATDGD